MRFPWRPVAATTLLALVVRVLYARLVGTGTLNGDALEFHLAGLGLADGHGFVDPFAWQRGVVSATADKPPLYTLSLGALSAVGLRSPGEQHASGVLTGVLLVPVVAALARAATGRRATTILAAALCALYPPLVMADGSLRSESLFALLVTCALLAALRYRHRPGSAWALAAGAAVALAALTRGEAVLLLVLLPLALWRWPGAGARPRLAHLGGGLAVAAVVLAPWLVRCWVTFDQPVAISTNTGGLLAGANCPQTYADGPFLGEWYLPCVPGTSERNEATASAALRRRGVDYARAHSSRLPKVVVARVGRTLELWHPREVAGQQSFFEGADPVVARWAIPAFWLVGLLALAALALRALPMGASLVLLSPAVAVAVVTLTAYGWPRFRVGAEPALVVLAAAGAVALADRLRTGRGADAARLAGR